MTHAHTAHDAKTGSAHRIFLVDDHPVVRAGLRLLIEQEDDLRVCGEAGTCAAAMSGIAETRPDLVITDVSLDGPDGLDLLRGLLKAYPDILVLVLSMHEESLYAWRVVRMGARGYIMKQQKPETVIDAIRVVLTGEIYLSDSAKKAMIKSLVGHGGQAGRQGVESLSNREIQVFQLLGAGHTIKDIAQRLGLSAKTVEVHRDNVRQKMGLATSMEVLQHAIRWVG